MPNSAAALREATLLLLSHIARQRPHYIALTRLNRPIGILLLLWPTWWALLIAGHGHPDLWIALVFTLGVVLTRSAGCIINDYADRGFDSRVRRTRDRPIAAGHVGTREALCLFAALMGIAFLLTLTLNRLTILLSIVALLLAGSYPYAKRLTYLPQFHLGLAFGWSIPMAFAAQTNGLPAICWLLLIANVLWSAIYDTMYAMADRDEDMKIGVKSTAILFGDMDRFILGILQLMLLWTLWLTGARADLNGWYDLSLLAAAGLAIYHQYLIRNRLPAACLQAFRHNHWLGMIVCAGIAADYLFGPGH